MTAGHVLVAENVDVHYGRLHAVRSATVRVDCDEIVALVGPNGAGKTSLIRALLGVERATASTLSLGDADLRRLKPHQRARAGLIAVPEGRALFPALTVRQNLELPQLIRSGWNDHATEGVLELFPRLRHRLTQQAGSLSGGEQQMLAISRALVSNPKVLVLDEVSLGLHPSVVQVVYEALQEVLHKTHIPTLVVEQHIARALDISNRCYVMVRGEIVEEGESATLRKETERLTGTYLSSHTARVRRVVSERRRATASLSVPIDAGAKRRIEVLAKRQGISVEELVDRQLHDALDLDDPRSDTMEEA